MNIKNNLENISEAIPENVCLIAVSKTKPIEDIQEAYDAGHRIFGENKAQELSTKHPQLPEDIVWHFIGHMQRNKVKFIAPFVNMIHSVDSLRLLSEINKQARKFDRKINCLLQFHIATEESKFGLDIEEASLLLESDEFKELKNIEICGLMGMATYTDNNKLIKTEFNSLKNFYNIIKEKYFPNNEIFKEISMGMSGDYQLAIEEGSTMVRIGSAIFGRRNYG